MSSNPSHPIEPRPVRGKLVFVSNMRWHLTSSQDAPLSLSLSSLPPFWNGGGGTKCFHPRKLQRARKGANATTQMAAANMAPRHSTRQSLKDKHPRGTKRVEFLVR